MGCQCANKEEENRSEIIKEQNGEDEAEDNNNLNSISKEGIFGLENQNQEENFDRTPTEKQDNDNENEQQENEINNFSLKNNKYADYPQKMLELINKIRENPNSYSDIIIQEIKNIITQDYDETKPKIIYKNKVKVALFKGESAFHEAAEILKNMAPLPPLIFKEEICVPLPETEEELNDNNYLKNQIDIIRENNNVDVYFKDLIKLPEVAALIMIVDDNEKNPGRKRNALLNEEFKYIGINNKFIGGKFLAYFTFSK